MLLALAVLEEGNELCLGLPSRRSTLLLPSSLLLFRRFLFIARYGFCNSNRVLANPFPRSCALLAILAMSVAALIAVALFDMKASDLSSLSMPSSVVETPCLPPSEVGAVGVEPDPGSPVFVSPVFSSFNVLLMDFQSIFLRGGALWSDSAGEV